MISPSTIKLRRAENLLELIFDDGERLSLPAEFLRVESPSAEVQGHNAAGRKLVSGKRQIAITAIEPTGNYAIRLTFSDGHDTGIFSWDYLRRLGRDQQDLWRRYLAQLEAAGLTR